MTKDLRDFLKTAKAAGPDFYVETKKPVRPEYEVGVIQHKLEKQGRFPVVYCPEVIGSKIPLVTSVYGSYDLLGLALGVSPQRLRDAGRGEVLQEYRRRRKGSRPVREVSASSAPIRDVVLTGPQADLSILPITLHAPLNSGKYVAVGMTVLRNPDTGQCNVGVYRQEVKGKDKLALMMDAWHHGGEIAQRYADLKRTMEVITFVGHHPLVGIAAATPTGREVNEFEFMGGLLEEPVEVTRGATVDLPVPAFAEIAIEGTVDPNNMSTEGPFAEGGGYYGEGRPCYIIDVTAITMRRDAIYNDLHPTHQEHRLVGMLGRESSILDKVRSAGVDATGVHVGPESRCGKVISYVSIKKRSPEDPRTAGVAALPPGRASKIAVVVDEDVDVFDEDEVLWALATRLSAAWAVNLTASATTFTPFAGDGGAVLAGGDMKLIVDATRSLGKKHPVRVLLPEDVWNSVSLNDYLK